MEQPPFPRPEIAPEAVEALRKVELIERTGKAEVLLVAGGLKPATEQQMRYVRGSSAYSLDDLYRNAQRFRTALDMLHLSHLSRPSESMEDVRITFWIADRPEVCEQLAQSGQLPDAERIPERGKLLGLPQTAIDAFPNAVIDKHMLPTEVRATRGYKLMEFMPSRDHWREELAELEERAVFVNQVTPGLLDDEPIKENAGE